MPKRYDVYSGDRRVGQVRETPDWEGEVVSFVLSWMFYLVFMAFVLLVRGARAVMRRN